MLRIFNYFIAILGFTACNNCQYLDCVVDDYYAYIKLVDGDSGSDLVFGNHAIYDTAQIKCYSLNGSDTINYNKTVTYAYGDTSLQIEFFPKTDKVFLQVAELDADTLSFKFNEYSTKCCGHITTISHIKFNNGEQIDNKGTVILMK